MMDSAIKTLCDLTVQEVVHVGDSSLATDQDPNRRPDRAIILRQVQYILPISGPTPDTGRILEGSRNIEWLYGSPRYTSVVCLVLRHPRYVCRCGKTSPLCPCSMERGAANVHQGMSFRDFFETEPLLWVSIAATCGVCAMSSSLHILVLLVYGKTHCAIVQAVTAPGFRMGSSFV
jgi:hypothetical protein